MEKVTLALDEAVVRESVRDRDKNGFLNVRTSRLTRDQVAPYYGKEIPNFGDLGLDPDRIYYGWRNPDELQKALETFNGKPLLIRHQFDSADRPNTELRIGTVGTSAKWEPPFVTNALSVWDKKAIEAIENGDLKDLSCGYRYRPDFTPGETPDGVAYDFVMRDIACNHVALVHEGRADDCYVEDALPEGMKMENTEKQGGACDDFTDFARKVIEGAGTNLTPEQVEALVSAFAAAHEKFQAAQPAVPEADDEDPAPEAKPAEDEDPAPAKDEEPAPAAAEDEEAKACDEDEPAPAEGAQDAAIAKMVKRHISAQFQAAADVKPVIGEVQPLAYDSADAIYMSALKQMGYRERVKPYEARAVFIALRSVKNASPVGAQDSAAAPKKSFLDKYL